MLGIAVSPRRCVLAEVTAGRAGAVVLRRSWEVKIESRDGALDWAALGSQIRHTLREQRFSVSRCIVGLDAAWVVAKPKTLGPTPPAALAGVMRLAIEREFASGSEGYIFDYVPPPDTKGESIALLLAGSRAVVEGVAAMTQAAGLTMLGVTCSSLVLAAAAGADGGDQAVLHLSEDGAELAVRAVNGWPALCRLTGPAKGSIAPSIEDARRVLALLPARAQAGPRQLLLCDELGLDSSAQAQLAGRLGLPLKLCRLPEDLGLVKGEALAAVPVAQAAALAAEAISGRALRVDFTHSRLAPAKPLGRRRKILMACGGAAVLVAGAIWFAADWWCCTRAADDLTLQIAQLKPAVSSARVMADNVNFARGWYDHRPSVLECLRLVTNAFPERAQAWATNISIREEKAEKKAVKLSGKCESEAVGLQILDNLMACPRFTSVTGAVSSRRVAANTPEWSFEIGFEYVPER